MYEKMTYDALLKRMLGRVSNKFDKREGSVIWDTHSPTAIELQILYLELENLIRDAYGDTATRTYLIKRCAERGIHPDPATNAILKGVFTPPEVDVTDKRFSLETLNYVVLGPYESGEPGEYQVQCEAPGRVGNQYTGRLIPIEYVNGLTSAELVEVLIPGRDEEDTEALRERYFNSFDDKAFGGNIPDYIRKTKELPGVGGVKVTRVWNGDISPAAMIPSKEVCAWFDETIGTLDAPVAAWLEMVYRAAVEKKLTVGGTVRLTILDADYNVPTDLLLDVVQTAIDPEQNAGEGYGLAPIGHVVSVKPVEAVEVFVKTKILFDTGFSFSNLGSEIKEIVETYFRELRATWEKAPYLIVRVSQIESRILDLEGVIDIQDTALNETAANLVLGRYEIPVLGGVSVDP